MFKSDHLFGSANNNILSRSCSVFGTELQPGLTWEMISGFKPCLLNYSIEVNISVLIMLASFVSKLCRYITHGEKSSKILKL